MKHTPLMLALSVFCLTLSAMTPEQRERMRQAWLARAELLQNRPLQEPQVRPEEDPGRIQRPVEPENRNQECRICGFNREDLAQDQAYLIFCCGQFICRNDAEQLEQRACELYRNLQDYEWRRGFAASPDFTGWPVAEEHARCPFCRKYPLITRPMPHPAQNRVDEVRHQCLICFDELAEDYLKRLECGHIFCTACLRHIVDVAIHEHTTNQLRCPNMECATQFTEQDIRTITDNNREILSMIAAVRTQEWIATQPNAKHCPTPDCPYVFLNEANCLQTITCTYCQREYCSQCLFPHMRTLTCEQAEQNRRMDEVDEDWVQRNTRPCPRCGARIIRDGGCNYVTCTNCHLGFCYYCNGNHHGGACELAQVMPIQRLQVNANPPPRLLQPHQREAVRMPAQLRHQPAARLARQRVQQEIAQDRAYILETKALYDITGIAQYREFMAQMNGVTSFHQSQIVVCLPQNTDINTYTNFRDFLNRLCSRYSRNGRCTEVGGSYVARRIIYRTMIDPATFQGLLNQANQQVFPR